MRLLLLALLLLPATVSAVPVGPPSVMKVTTAVKQPLGMVEKAKVEKIRRIGTASISVDRIYLLNRLRGQTENLFVTETTPPFPVRPTSPDAQACSLGIYSRTRGQVVTLKVLSPGTSCNSVEAVMYADLDGDGKDDLVIISSQRPRTTPVPVQVYTVFRSTGPWKFEAVEKLNNYLHTKATARADPRLLDGALKQFFKPK